MAKFEVLVTEVLDVKDHPNADKLDILKVFDFQLVSGKGNWSKGDLGVYIPEGSILPLDIQEKLDVVGLLSGPDKNRMKAVKLRGEISQGMMLPISFLDFNVLKGDDVSKELGITKYIPRVPETFQGKWITPPEHLKPIKFDVENIKKHPNMFGDGEDVYVTEKLHGTCFQAVVEIWPEVADVEGFLKYTHSENNKDSILLSATSKGVGAKGFLMDAKGQGNIYTDAAKRYMSNDKFVEGLVDFRSCSKWRRSGNVFRIFGEVFGSGVQDLQYGLSDKQLRVFDVYYGGSFLGFHDLSLFCEKTGLEMIPNLFEGQYNIGKIKGLSCGNSVIDSEQLMEGVVVRPIFERKTSKGERAIAKFISERYLTRSRKGKTEPTEYN